jgi:AcrR family transcriptional regulator
MPAAPASSLRPRERARHARRAALLETAEQVFAERGFVGATMAEIAARAGYSTHVTEVLLGALRRPGSIRERLDGLIDAFLGFGEKHRNFFVILSQPTGTFDWGTGATTPEGDAIRDRIDHQLLSFFAQGAADGVIAPGDPRVYMNLVSGALSAYVADWIRRDGMPGELWGDAGMLRAAVHRALGVKEP